MAKGRKLTDDVSIEELLLMRDEEGLSNYEIAMRVGVAKNTIYRLIGKQPPHIRADNGLQTAAKVRNTEVIRPKHEEVVPAALVLETRAYRLAGVFARYWVDEQAGTVQINSPDGAQMELELKHIEDFIKELQAIRRKLKEPKPMEAW